MQSPFANRTDKKASDGLRPSHLVRQAFSQPRPEREVPPLLGKTDGPLCSRPTEFATLKRLPRVAYSADGFRPALMIGHASS